MKPTEQTPPPLTQPTWSGRSSRQASPPPPLPEEEEKKPGTYRFEVSYRNGAYAISALLFLALWVFFDPHTGVVTELPWGGALVYNLLLLSFATAVICFNHITLRKILFPYVDIERLVERAAETGQAGTALISLALFMIAVAITFTGVVIYIKDWQ